MANKFHPNGRFIEGDRVKIGKDHPHNSDGSNQYEALVIKILDDGSIRIRTLKYPDGTECKRDDSYIHSYPFFDAINSNNLRFHKFIEDLKCSK